MAKTEPLIFNYNYRDGSYSTKSIDPDDYDSGSGTLFDITKTGLRSTYSKTTIYENGSCTVEEIEINEN